MSKNLFSGQSSTTGSLFGQQSSNSGANNSNQQSNTTSNPFGGGGSSAPLFGGTQNQAGATQSPFASSASAPTGSSGFSFGNNKPEEKEDQGNGSAKPFNMFSTPNKDSSQSQTSGLFGQQVSSGPSTFGNASTTPAGPPPTNSLFGNLGQTQKSTTSLFGSAQQNTQQSDQSSQKSPNLFANSSSASLFSTTPSSSGNTNQLFGKPAATTAAGTPTETPKSLFGNNNYSSSQQTSAPTSNSLFATSSSAPVAKSGFSFPGLGQNTAQSSGQATPTTTATDKPSPFLGGSAATATGSSTSLFPSSGQNQSSQASEDQQTKAKATTTPASNLFAGLSQKKDDQPQSQSPSLFAGIRQNKDKDASNAQDEAKKSSSSNFSLFQNADQNKDINATATTAPASSSTATTGATATAPGTTTASSGGLFGGAPASKQDTFASKTSEAGGLGSSTLGASTAGPAPTAQSRLKNKSMDEIITRWATDLSKYQKEFQAQAEKVAAWDRMLLENSNAISTLYSKTYHAERDTAEVQKQLSAVESHQDELSHWLDRYEREVDEMMVRQVGQGESLQGPDQERERTYKIAGRVSERLDEMGKDLTSMIDEINEASATISKTNKPDDPLSQIVRVLNGHLSQLQLIDQGAAELRGKIDAAQKETSRLGSKTNGSFGSSDVDNFYRSYMKRG